jgi:glycosyltransferase involved in cell wall biosynthesis
LFQAPAHMKKFRIWRYVAELKAIELGSSARRGKLVMRKLPAFIEGAELKKLMASIDLFLLPYAMPDYFHRGSGFVIDAVTLGRPIVYSRGLGMSELLSNGNAEMASTPDQFAEKIVEVMSKPEEYRRGCELASERLQVCLENTRQLLRCC